MASCSPVAEASMRTARSAVDELVKLLHSFKEFNVAEVKESGSMGHGTVVPGNFDIDLVVYSRDIKAEEVKNFGCDRWLRQLQAFLRSTPELHVQIERLTSHAVQFKYKKKIDVDLLVSPYWGNDPNSFYKFLRTVPKGEQFDFSVNASKWQVEFFSKQPPQVKEFIQRAKAWRNHKWGRSTNGKPKSYMLSVLVLRAYENAMMRIMGAGSTQEIAMQTTAELKQLVNNHHRIDIYWEEYYERRDYSDLLPSRPRIIDPANPSNNLYITGIGGVHQASDYEPGDGNWAQLKVYIHTLDLSQPVEHWPQP